MRWFLKGGGVEQTKEVVTKFFAVEGDAGPGDVDQRAKSSASA